MSTPLYAAGTNYGLLHFEVALAYYHQLLKSTLPPDTFFAAIAGVPGEFVCEQREPPRRLTSLFAGLGTLSGDAGMHAANPDLLRARPV